MPASTDAARLDTRGSMRRSGKAKGSSTPNGSTRLPSHVGSMAYLRKPILEISMRVSRESSRAALIIPAMAVAGFAFTLYVFYPGIPTFDSLYVYKDMVKGAYGDWQSPIMLALWSLIDPIAPGTGSILVLTVVLYWLAFALFAL